MIVLRPEASTLLVEATRRGQLVVASDRPFNGMKVFCATADAVAWIDAHPELDLVDITVAQDSAWTSIVIAYWEVTGSARSRT